MRFGIIPEGRGTRLIWDDAACEADRRRAFRRKTQPSRLTDRFRAGLRHDVNLFVVNNARRNYFPPCILVQMVVQTARSEVRRAF